MWRIKLAWPPFRLRRIDSAPRTPGSDPGQRDLAGPPHPAGGVPRSAKRAAKGGRDGRDAAATKVIDELKRDKRNLQEALCKATASATEAVVARASLRQALAEADGRMKQAADERTVIDRKLADARAEATVAKARIDELTRTSMQPRVAQHMAPLRAPEHLRSGVEKALRRLPDGIRARAAALVAVYDAARNGGLAWLEEHLDDLAYAVFSGCEPPVRNYTGFEYGLEDATNIVALQVLAATALRDAGVHPICPTEGDAYDDSRHMFTDRDLVLTDRTADLDGRIVSTARIGFESNGIIVRKARVRRYLFADSDAVERCWDHTVALGALPDFCRRWLDHETAEHGSYEGVVLGLVRAAATRSAPEVGDTLRPSSVSTAPPPPPVDWASEVALVPPVIGFALSTQPASRDSERRPEEQPDRPADRTDVLPEDRATDINAGLRIASDGEQVQGTEDYDPIAAAARPARRRSGAAPTDPGTSGTNSEGKPT